VPISIENNSWDYVLGLIEKEINSAFKLRMDFVDEIPEEEKDELVKAIKELTEEVRELRELLRQRLPQ